MHNISATASTINPSLLLRAYELGIFPMADGDDPEKIIWIEPKQRGVITMDSAIIPKRVWQYIRSQKPRIVFDEPLCAIIHACAKTTLSRQKTWINQTIVQAYRQLFTLGSCHTVSVYNDKNEILGGLYGIAQGSAFFGESMVSFAPRTSQMALAALLLRMAQAGFTLLDCQFFTPHLQKFGCYELPHQAYLVLLKKALGTFSSKDKKCQKNFMENYHENELVEASFSCQKIYPFFNSNKTCG